MPVSMECLWSEHRLTRMAATIDMSIDCWQPFLKDLQCSIRERNLKNETISGLKERGQYWHLGL